MDAKRTVISSFWVFLHKEDWGRVSRSLNEYAVRFLMFSFLFAILCFLSTGLFGGRNVGWVTVKGNIILRGSKHTPNPPYHCLKALSCK